MALFNKILIANRGEIACRIMRTAKKLGIKTVAVFSDVDCNALHVKMADEAYLIGQAPSKDSYLNIEKIISVAKQSGASAIHPGYGFLSENSEFAKACEKENIIFVGPSSFAINLMASKNVAKEKMREHDVPTVPGFYDEQQSSEKLLTAAKKIGFPVVLKAVAGGGGKGLRLVQSEKEFEQAYLAVRREAKAFFNDEKVLLEKYLSNARHVEVQILADHYNNVQHLYTRDCSIQRRHQKIIEEAPAPNIPEQLQQKITKAAIQAAKAIQYTNAGTIEFLVEENDFYFMEMNTRLQVEHPVTEMITGLDLVEWQLKIAAGEKLFEKPATSKGHSIEVRLNAEDPENDFLPSSGKLNYFQFPSANKNVRIDSGYQQGDIIDIYYDSLLAKLIVWGENRSLAINSLKQVLSDTYILGIKTNLPLLKAILENENFAQSNFNTLFLQKENLNISTPMTDEVFAAAALFLVFNQNNFAKNISDEYSPWVSHDGWQLYHSRPFTFQFSDGEKIIHVEMQKNDTLFSVKVNDKNIECLLLSFTSLECNVSELAFLAGNQHWSAKISKNHSKLEIIANNNYYNLELLQDDYENLNQERDEQLLAPMPGTIVALLVNSGQKVTKGDKLIVIEAMKMEHTLYAPRDGVIKQCYYKIGDLIKEGSELIEFES